MGPDGVLWIGIPETAPVATIDVGRELSICFISAATTTEEEAAPDSGPLSDSEVSDSGPDTSADDASYMSGAEEDDADNDDDEV